MPLRIGVWGGSFDPVHIGHLILAQEAAEACALDRLIWMPSGSPPHKPGPFASGMDRVDMIAAAIQDHPDFEVSTAEIEREGASYTCQTLEELQSQEVDDLQLVLLIGADNALDFDQWHRPDRVLELAEVVVFDRPGATSQLLTEAVRGRMRLLGTPLIDVSSTAIRDRILAGKSIRYWVPEPVRSLIEARGLY